MIGSTPAHAFESLWHGQFRINSYYQNASKDDVFTKGDDIQASRLRFRPTVDCKFDNGVKAHIQLNIGHINSNIANARYTLDGSSAGDPVVSLRHGYISAPIPKYEDWTAMAGLIPLSDKFGDTLFSSDWDWNPLAYALMGKVGDMSLRIAHANLDEGGENTHPADDLDQWIADLDTNMGLGVSFYALNANTGSGAVSTATQGAEKTRAENRELPEPFSSESNFVNIPCLAVLKESHLAALVLSGVGNSGLDCSRCSSCALRGAKEVIWKTARYAENPLALLARAGRIEVLEVMDGGSKSGFGFFGKGGKGRKKGVRKITNGPEYSRRELFTFLKGRAAALAVESKPGRHIEREEVLENPAALQKRMILLEALRAADATASGAIKDGGFPVRQIGINGKCVMCRRCDAFCPTRALKRAQTKGEVRIEFRTALCMGCHQCREFCPAGAIFYEKEVGIDSLKSDEAKVIMKRETVNCPGCSKPFVPEIDKDGCPECGKKKRLEANILSIIFSKPHKGKQTGKEAI